MVESTIHTTRHLASEPTSINQASRHACPTCMQSQYNHHQLQARHVAHTDTQYTPPVDTDVHINTTLTHHAWTVPVEVELHKLLTILDTGVRYSLVAKKWLDEIAKKLHLKLRPVNIRISVADLLLYTVANKDRPMLIRWCMSLTYLTLIFCLDTIC